MDHWKKRMGHQASILMKLVLIAGLALDAGTIWSAQRTNVKTQRDAQQPSNLASHNVINPESSPSLARHAYARLPLSFEANLGQTDRQVNFLARGSGYTLFLTSTEAVLRLRIADCGLRIDDRPWSIARRPLQTTTDNRQRTTDTSAVVRMKLVGSNPQPHALGLKELPGKVNYLIGNDPTKWRTNVPTYASVKYQDVYRGVDMVYYGTQGQLEYDFIVAPGADPKVIALNFEGAEKLELDAQGDLIVHTAGSQLRMRKPTVYQQVGGARHDIAASYTLDRNDQVGFQVDAYDRSRALVIDPFLIYSTYLGGSLGDVGSGVNVDFSGFAYIVGSTVSLDFPTPSGFQPMPGGGRDVFVTKVNAMGTGLVFSTYLGGSGDDEATGIGIDPLGVPVVAGVTNSANFPTRNAFQLLNGGGTDAFVSKLRPGGAGLIYSTYLGGVEDDGATDVTVDSNSSAYIVGATRSVNFPTSARAFDRTCGTDALCNGGEFDGFVSKFNPNGTVLSYSTFIGGSKADAARGVTTDASGNAYVTGVTESTDFPTRNPLQPAAGGGADAFVLKLAPRGSALVYSTYLGGSGADAGAGIGVDLAGAVTVTGTTASTNFPTASALQPSNAGGEDAFIAKLNGRGTNLAYSTYFGGSNDDRGADVGLNLNAEAYIVGTTRSPNFLTKDAIQATFGGGDSDAFVIKLAPRGQTLFYSTFLGGSGNDLGARIAIDATAAVYVTGTTFSTDFPTMNPLRPASGLSDAFAAKITDIPPPPGPTGTSR